MKAAGCSEEQRWIDGLNIDNFAEGVQRIQDLMEKVCHWIFGSISQVLKRIVPISTPVLDTCKKGIDILSPTYYLHTIRLADN